MRGGIERDPTRADDRVSSRQQSAGERRCALIEPSCRLFGGVQGHDRRRPSRVKQGERTEQREQRFLHMQDVAGLIQKLA